ncbi:DUF4382 domain-containing protein [Vibrio hangzhouensis]|uniref:DUF4382 domain-containing protein n=1 Tax=Vibrio hangzhouensis TaxID=462991 RepID=A0A1H5YJC6_9VIBR|nr:DUF4382 domain-containing protein [Vibrio hangzhouensis]SEG24233.1 protein of unknown function [Vibrio hangzhouensis]
MKYAKLTTLAALTSLALVGCGGDSDSVSTTPLTLSVSDAPVDGAKEVVVTFGKVALLPQNGNSPIVYDVYETDENGEPILDNNGERIPLSINLLSVQGSLSLPLIKDEVVPVGDYKLCVFANDGDHPSYRSYVVEDENETDISAHPGLTVKGDGACPQGVGKEDFAGVLYFNNAFAVNADNNDFVVEFDLRRGLRDDPQAAGDYVIQRTSVSIINTVTTGNIEGTVATTTFDSCFDASTTQVDGKETYVQAVYLYDGSVAQENMAPIGGPDDVKPLTSAAVNMNQEQTGYEFSFGFLEPGSYNLGYTCTAQHDDGEEGSNPVADGFSVYKVEGVTVDVGQNSQVAF